MTLRARLSLVLVLAVAIGAVVFNVAARVAVERILHERVDRDLGGEVDRTMRRLGEGTPGRDGPRLGGGLRGGAGFGEGGVPGARVFGPRALVAEVRDSDGEILVSTASVDAVGGLPDADDLEPGDAVRFRSIDLDGEPYRIAEARGRSGSLVQVAQPLDDLGNFLDTLRWVLVAGGIVAVVAALLFARWAARATLRPIDTMTATARRIASDPRTLGHEHVQPAFADPELRSFAESMNDMLGSLAESDERQRRFVADASHELRTPLTSLSGNASYIDRTASLDGDAREALEAVGRDVERLVRIADGLTTLARLDSTGGLQLEPVDVDAVVAEAAARVRSAHPGHELRVDSSAGTVVLDAELLRRIVGNLLDNAGRYTPSGSVVQVRAEAAAGALELVVEDDGPGLDDAERELVRSRFHRGSTSAHTSGTGLGLAIVDESARALGGRLDIDAVRPHGLRCRVAIPTGSAAPDAG